MVWSVLCTVWEHNQTQEQKLKVSLSSLLGIICLSFCFLILFFAADPPFKTCARTWRKVGCFKDLIGGERALKEQMVNIRDRSSKVFPAGEPKLSWKHLTQSFHRYALKLKCYFWRMSSQRRLKQLFLWQGTQRRRIHREKNERDIKGVARDSHLGLWINLVQSSV